MIERGVFATIVTTLEILCVKLPDELGFSEASNYSLLISSYYILFESLGLEKGQISNFVRNNHSCAGKLIEVGKKDLIGYINST